MDDTDVKTLHATSLQDFGRAIDSYPAGVAAAFVCAVAGFCVRDMRKYPFWARGAQLFEKLRLNRQERYSAIARPEGARPNLIANYEL